ncbi:HD-GYP domain-containing protein [Hydrogenophaga aquatica]
MPSTIDPNSPTVALDDLRVGLYVHLDLGWMDHPFPLGSFKITSQQQIDTIRSLGLQRLRYSPEKSDPAPATVPQQPLSAESAAEAEAPPLESDAQRHLREQLETQRRGLLQCERQFTETARGYRLVIEELTQRPAEAKERSAAMVGSMVRQMLGQGESAIRLLSEGTGDRASLHAVNVTVLSLLLGKAMGLDQDTLQDLGMAALLHDMGKIELPDRVRYRDEHFTPPQFKLYQEHVMHGVALGKRMGMSTRALLTLSQHHEQADGKGFPLGCGVEKITPGARILALINRYDNLCNPTNPINALTPHEALSLIFATMKERFDSATLSAFIRMMGIYPPGSLVQLSDQRYAMVVSVNSSRPLKPKVLVHDSTIKVAEALLLDLESTPQLCIQRSLKAHQLPRQAVEYLAPRQRVCYFFERAVEHNITGEESA